MKRLLLLPVVLSLGLAFSAQAESLARLESKDGNVDVLGCDVTKADGQDYLVVLLNYENTKEESASPDWEMNVQAFLDGIEMEHGYIYDFKYDGFKEADTQIRPGASLQYFMLFELEGEGKIEVEVSPLMNWDNESVSCELDLSNTGYTATPAEDANTTTEEQENEPTEEQEYDVIAELEARIAALEERVEALENK